ncbi:hypothetical protein VPH35_026265 [Triticum aestivum]
MDAQKKVEDGREMVEDGGVREPPDWLPDGWIWEVRRGDDGELYEYYICPVSGAEFRMKAEVLNYLFSEMDEKYIESMDAAAAPGMLHKEHDWLPEGWRLEIRAGGENKDKMYKVLAELILNPSGLPPGWVLEFVYRKAGSNGEMRKDPYYTDPVSHYTFRTLKSAVRYVETEELTERAFIQNTSVHEVYNFDKSADLHESLRKRLQTKDEKAATKAASSSKPGRSSREVEINYHEKTLNRVEDIDTSMDPVSPNECKEIKKKSRKTTRKEPNSSKSIKDASGRPSK